MPKKRTDDQRLFDDTRIAEMVVKGKTQAAIGQQIGISAATVNRSLKRIRNQWKAIALEETTPYIGMVFETYRKLVDENWKAWENSIGETRKEVRRVRRRNADEEGTPDAAEVTVHVETLNGDPRYLSNIARCMEGIRDLLGLDAPKRAELTGSIEEIEEIVIRYEEPPWAANLKSGSNGSMINSNRLPHAPRNGS